MNFTIVFEMKMDFFFFSIILLGTISYQKTPEFGQNYEMTKKTTKVDFCWTFTTQFYPKIKHSFPIIIYLHQNDSKSTGVLKISVNIRQVYQMPKIQLKRKQSIENLFRN